MADKHGQNGDRAGDQIAVDEKRILVGSLKTAR